MEALQRKNCWAARERSRACTCCFSSAKCSLQLLADRKEIQWLDQRYEPHLLEAATLVFAATDDAQLNEQISNDAKKYDILVCNVSEGQQGSFITPAIARSGELTAAISSAGSSPSLVKMMKQELEQHYLPRYANAQQLMKQLRAQVLRSNLSAEQRKNCYPMLRRKLCM